MGFFRNLAAYRKGIRLIFLNQDVDIVWQHKRKWRRQRGPREEFSFLFNSAAITLESNCSAIGLMLAKQLNL